MSVKISSLNTASTIDSGDDINIAGNNPLTFSDWGGGWFMQDGTYIRSLNQKSIWLGDGVLASQGGLSVGYGGTLPTAGYGIIAGRLGVGLNSPTARLDLTTDGNGTTAAYSGIHIRQNSTSVSEDVAARLTFNGDGGTTIYGFIEQRRNSYDSFALGTKNSTGSGAGYVSLYTQGNESVRIAGGGNVLIGTITDSGYKLVVNGGQFGTYLRGGDMGTGSDVVRMVKSDNSTAMLVRGDGNIGINTTAPQKILDVVSGANNFVTVGADGLGVGQWAGIHFGYRENNALYRKSAIVFERTDNAGGGGNAAGKVYILNGPGSGAGSATLADAKLTIDEYGKVGIGTTTPLNKLVAVNDGVYNSENSYAIAAAAASDPAYKMMIGYDWVNDVGIIAAVHTAVAWKNISIPQGNLLIGTTTNAGYKLDVNGTTRATVLRAQKSQTSGDYTTAAIWTESYSTTTTGIAFHINGTVGKFLEMRTNGILYWEGNPVITTGNVGSYAAAVDHTHNLGRYSLSSGYIDGLTSTTFRTTLFGINDNSWNISTARWNTVPAPLSGMNMYGTLLAWSGADTQGFIATDYSTANIQVGGGSGNNINWKVTLIHSGNIGSQSVSYATTAGSASQIDGWDFTNTGSNLNTVPDSINSNGISYTLVSLLGQSDGALYSQAYSSAWQHQVFGDYRTGQIAVRGKNNGTWQAWRTVIDSGNIGSYALPTSGGTLTGDLTTSGWFINSTDTYGIKNSANNSSFWSQYARWVVNSNDTTSVSLAFYTQYTQQFSIGRASEGIYIINDQDAEASILCYQGAGYGGYLTGTWNVTNNLTVDGYGISVNNSATYATALIFYKSSAAEFPSSDVWSSGMVVDATSSLYIIGFNDASIPQSSFRLYESGRLYLYGDVLSINSYGAYTSCYLRLAGSTAPNDWFVKQSDSTGFSIIKNADTFYGISTAGTHSFSSTSNLLARFTDSGSTFGVTQGNYNRAYFHVTGAVGATHAMFGTTYPLLFGSNYPTVYYNMYYSSGWKIASGTSVYGGATVYDPVNGIFYWYLTGTAASTDGTVTPAIQFRIDRNGQVSIGTTASSTHKLYVTGTTYLGGNVGVLGNVNATNLNASTLTTNGIVYSNGGTLTNINPSDLRLKEDINPLQYGLKEVMALNPVTYKWKDGSNGGQRSTGLIAQDVKEVMPDYVKNVSEDSDLLGLDSYAINIVLINAIKELKAEIEILKNK